VFTHAYALMTRRIATDLPASGAADPDWVVDLAEAFAARYFHALDAYDARGEVPPAWQAVFGTICARRTSVVEDLVFAMTAHIVRDLPHALLDVGLAGPDGSTRIHDFHLVNDTMGHSVDDVQAEVSRRYGPYVRFLDRIGERYDEILTNYGIRMSRGLAWYNAVRLQDPLSSEAAAASVERSPKVVIDEVMRPPIWSLRIALRSLRWVVAHLRRWPSADGAARGRGGRPGSSGPP
jgi:hypothetical protein